MEKVPGTGPNRHLCWGVATALTLAIFLIMWFGHLPLPHNDDMVFWGASVGVAQTRELINPYIHDNSTFFGTRKTLNFLPFYFHILGGWMHLFGPSTLSLFYYQTFWAVIGALAAARLASRFGAGSIAAGFAAFLWIFPLLCDTGIRYELTFYGLTVVGLAFLDWSLTGWILGWTFLALANLTHVIALAYSLPLAVAVLWIHWPGWAGKNRKEIARLAGTFLLLTLGAILFFTWMIQGAFHDFLHAFFAHVGIRKKSGNEILSILHNDCLRFPGVITLLPIVLLGIVAWALLLTRPGLFSRNSRILYVAGSVGILLHTLMYVHTVHVAGLAMLSFALVVLLSQLQCSPLIKQAAALYLGGCILVGIIGLIVLNHGGSLPTMADKEKIRHYVMSQQDHHQITVDTVAAKWVLDYQFSPAIQSWEWRKPYPEFAPYHLSQQEPDEIWILSAESLLYYTDDAQSILNGEPRITVFGKTLHPFLLNPWKIFVIQHGHVVSDPK